MSSEAKEEEYAPPEGQASTPRQEQPSSSETPSKVDRIDLNNRPQTSQSMARTMRREETQRPKTTQRMERSATAPGDLKDRTINYETIRARSPHTKIGTAPRFFTPLADQHVSPAPTSYTPDLSFRIGQRGGLMGKFDRQKVDMSDTKFVTPLLAYSTSEPRYMLNTRGGMFTNHAVKFGKYPRYENDKRWSIPGPGHVGGTADGSHTATATARSKATRIGREKKFFGFKALLTGGYEFEYKPDTFGKNYDGRLDQNRGPKMGKASRHFFDFSSSTKTPGPNVYNNDPSAHQKAKYNGFNHVESSGFGQSARSAGVIGKEERFKAVDIVDNRPHG